MMRSMFTGVSGLRAHQTMMDVVGNNIANVNTAGFKASQVTFSETMSQVLRGGSGNAGERGGINPMTIGLGTAVASIDGVFTQGASQVTGRTTDLAIQGAGFFVLESGGQRMYSRAGSFSFDEAGTLVAPQGGQVMGWTADATGEVETNGEVAPITLPVGQTIAPVITSEVELGGNLPADAEVGTEVTTSIAVFDSQGREHTLTLAMTKTATNRWTAEASTDEDASVTIGGAATATLDFGADGTLTTATPLALSIDVTSGAGSPIVADLVLAGGSPLVQFGGTATAEARGQDGQGIGFLRDFAISDDGAIFGQFSNGASKLLGRVATAAFNNPAGLQPIGSSMFAATPNSGTELIGPPGSGNLGLLAAGTLEMSNVDLAREFTNLIVAQRGFQANSRVITTSDEMLSELVNLKR